MSEQPQRERERVRHKLLYRCQLLERNNNPRFLKEKTSATCNRLGSVSNDGSQAGMTYAIHGIFCTICACAHGYAIGNILVN